MHSNHTDFDPVGICRVLAEERVEFVVVGGFAAVVHGSPIPTHDIDIVPDRSTANLDRVANALRRLNARIRTAREPIAAPLDGPFPCVDAEDVEPHDGSR